MKSAVLLLLIAGVAFPLVAGFHVEPVSASQSGWTHRQYPYNSVSQVLTCNFDELDSASSGYCELFGGEYGQGGAYNLSIYEYPGGTLMAHQD